MSPLVTCAPGVASTSSCVSSHSVECRVELCLRFSFSGSTSIGVAPAYHFLDLRTNVSHRRYHSLDRSQECVARTPSSPCSKRSLQTQLLLGFWHMTPIPVFKAWFPIPLSLGFRMGLHPHDQGTVPDWASGFCSRRGSRTPLLSSKIYDSGSST